MTVNDTLAPMAPPPGAPMKSVRTAGGPHPIRARRESGATIATRWVLFLFIVLYYFPVSTATFNAYKIVGWVLAGMAAALVLGGGGRLRLTPSFVIPASLLFVAGVVGAVSFGSIRYVFTAKMAQNLVLMALVPILIKGLPDIAMLLRAIATGAALTAASGFTDPAGLLEGRLAGITANANGYGQVCAQGAIALVALVMLSRKKWPRWLLSGLVAMCFVGLVLSGSRGAMVALTAALVAFLFMRQTRGVAIGATLVVGVITAVAMPERLAERWQSALDRDPLARTPGIGVRLELASRGVDVFKGNPVFGTGFGNVQGGMAQLGLDATHVTHNVLTQVMSETGAVGLVAFLALMGLTAPRFFSLPTIAAMSYTNAETSLQPMRPGSGHAGPTNLRLGATQGQPTPATSGRRPARSDARHVSARQRRQRFFHLIRHADPISAVLVALFVAASVGQLSSGNYVHAIWYIFFGLGLSLATWEQRLQAARRAATLRARLAVAPPHPAGQGAT